MVVRVLKTPLGRIGVAAGDRGVVRVMLPNEAARRRCRTSGTSVGTARAKAHAAQAEREIREYCAGRLRTFSAPIDLAGVPPFHRRVLTAARRIPYGQTVTYGELARRVGSPRAARAVGQAMAHNPIALIVPCHRVVAAGGGLGGFGGGLTMKRRLLALERGVCV
jgi:methylated-DNA-[protein]-cysteine S-methyltransferase